MEVTFKSNDAQLITTVCTVVCTMYIPHNWLGMGIDKLYTQIGNVNRLHNIIEPFAALFWALGIVLAHILQ